ncbi:MAG: 5'/3'-nucleotidase SurE [Acidilobaceae archaeon]|nr:5'/3'-nucleotidase SurE [Acidilobaceae archaeon]
MPVALAVNDDGIDSPGLSSLVRELRAAGFTVYVSAPRDQMSGMSKTVNFKRLGRNGEVEVRRVRLDGAEEAWALNATPAESVLLGFQLMGFRPEVVVSGVNIGPNLGLEDFFTSGTIGAAIEAALHGVPAVAVSLVYRRVAPEEKYRLAARVASLLASAYDSWSLKYDLLNLNVPLSPRGVKITRLALNVYRPRYEIDGSKIRVIEGDIRESYWDLQPGSDVWAALNGIISVTPIRLRSLLEPAEDPSPIPLGELEGLVRHEAPDS